MAKRFYKNVTVKPVPLDFKKAGDNPENKGCAENTGNTGNTGNGFGIFLDNRRLKTPGKYPLVLLEKIHADLIAQEWEAQTEDIVPQTMPGTRLVNVAIEQTSRHREQVIAEGCNYAKTDVLCYRAEAPEALARRQAEMWDPVLDWARGRGINLDVTTTIMAIPQAEASIAAFRNQLDAMTDLELTLCVHFIAVYGSAILGLAVIEKHIEARAAFALSRLDALWQIEHWGADEEAQNNIDLLRAELSVLSKFIL